MSQFDFAKLIFFLAYKSIIYIPYKILFLFGRMEIWSKVVSPITSNCIMVTFFPQTNIMITLLLYWYVSSLVIQSSETTVTIFFFFHSFFFTNILSNNTTSKLLFWNYERIKCLDNHDIQKKK